jgi:uncharacterized membrane protein YfcA
VVFYFVQRFPENAMLFAIALYLAFGAVAGFLAGLLGIGGGIVIVPMLHYAFRLQQLPPASIPIMAVATSMACIVFTSISSIRAHHAQGGVRWDVWRGITPGILLGTFCGTWVAKGLSGTVLQVIFVCFLLFVCSQMLLNIKPKPTRSLPGTPGMAAVGTGIGGISSLVGIGGGTMSVPFLTLCNVPFHACIGTSAAIGLPIAFAGTLGYVINGWNAPDLPPHTFGFVYLPACFGVVVASTLCAGFGAKVAHKLPTPKLKRVFACFLIVVAANMIWNLL